MKREARPLTKAELAMITSPKPVLRRIPHAPGLIGPGSLGAIRSPRDLVGRVLAVEGEGVIANDQMHRN